MVYKVGSAVGAVGTVGGIGGTVVMSNKAEATAETKVETELKTFIDAFEIKPEEGKSIFEAIKEKIKDFKDGDNIKVSKVVSAIKGIGEKAIDETKTNSEDKKALEKIKTKRADVEKLTDVEIKKLKGFLETTGTDGKTKTNNVCELIQKELFRRLAEKEFKLEIEKDKEFEKAVLACWRKN